MSISSGKSGLKSILSHLAMQFFNSLSKNSFFSKFYVLDYVLTYKIMILSSN